MSQGPKVVERPTAGVARHTSLLQSIVEKLSAGAIAGIIGSCATFPIDTVKTRLQNQKPGPDGRYPYNGMADCFKKSVARALALFAQAGQGRASGRKLKTFMNSRIILGGFGSLYRGLPAVILGITPEKAIKLAVNDLVCERFRLNLGVHNLPIPYLVLAGAAAGTCQVIATNPMEITKLRMQLGSLSLADTVKEMGIRGLYKGVAATLARDVPFSMIYFSLYGYLKQKCDNEFGHAPTWKVFLAGISSGMTAAVCSTPADVIKTRYQAVPEPGTVPYSSIREVVTRTWANEGPSAFFKGAGPRALVIGPLFGIALAVYELQKVILDKYLA